MEAAADVCVQAADRERRHDIQVSSHENLFEDEEPSLQTVRLTCSVCSSIISEIVEATIREKRDDAKDESVEAVFQSILRQKSLDMRDKKAAIVDFIAAGIHTVRISCSLDFLRCTRDLEFYGLGEIMETLTGRSCIGQLGLVAGYLKSLS